MYAPPWPQSPNGQLNDEQGQGQSAYSAISPPPTPSDLADVDARSWQQDGWEKDLIVIDDDDDDTDGLADGLIARMIIEIRHVAVGLNMLANDIGLVWYYRRTG